MFFQKKFLCHEVRQYFDKVKQSQTKLLKKLNRTAAGWLKSALKLNN